MGGAPGGSTEIESLPALGEGDAGADGAAYPLCRSITGDGVRATLDLLAESLHWSGTRCRPGTQAFDWTLADEWNVRDA